MRFFLRFLPSRDLLAVQPIRWLLLSRLCSNIFLASTTIVIFQQQRGLNFTEMFLMESILSGAIWLADVPTSIWADRFGYRRMIMLGHLCSVVGGICIIFAYGFWMFAFANVLSGFALACTLGSESALLYHHLPSEERERQGNAVFALLNMSSTGGIFLGLITGSFIGAISPMLAVVASTVPQLCSLLAAWHIQEQPLLQADPTHQTSTNMVKIVQVALATIRQQPVLIGLKTFSSAAFALTNAIFWLNQPYFARAGIPVALFGPLTALALGLQLFLMAHLTTLLQRLGIRTMLILACCLPGTAYILLAKTTQPLLTVALVACVAGAFSLPEPLVNNLLNKNIKDESRATTLSALSFVGSIVGMITNPLIGALGDRGMNATGLGLGVSLVLLCLLVPFLCGRVARK